VSSENVSPDPVVVGADDDRPLHLAVALDGAGWHPAAWREPTATPDGLFTAGYWVERIRTAERGLLDFATIEDSLGLQPTGPNSPDGRSDQVRGRLDAVLTAARVAPLTKHIGIVPTATVIHTEPFHVSKAIATLDYVSTGRAGWRAQLSADAAQAQHFGRRTVPQVDPRNLSSPETAAVIDELFDEAADFVEVVRRLWDSWEDDAEIRDASTGRFVDRDKLHYIDFQSRHFSVRGPSIVPRPPQGQPLVTALAHITSAYRFAARSADVIFVTPTDTNSLASILAEVRYEIKAAGRPADEVKVFADLVVFLDERPGAARDRKARLDELDGTEYRSDALIFTGTAAELADLIAEWHQAGLDGFRLRPGAIPDDADAVTDRLVPLLQERGLFRQEYTATTLRGHLGLERPQNRYATEPSTGAATTTLQGVSA